MRSDAAWARRNTQRGGKYQERGIGDPGGGRTGSQAADQSKIRGVMRAASIRQDLHHTFSSLHAHRPSPLQLHTTSTPFLPPFRPCTCAFIHSLTATSVFGCRTFFTSLFSNKLCTCTTGAKEWTSVNGASREQRSDLGGGQ